MWSVGCKQTIHYTRNILGNRRNFQLGSVCLPFPLITCGHTLTNRLTQDTGNKRQVTPPTEVRCSHSPAPPAQPREATVPWHQRNTVARGQLLGCPFRLLQGTTDKHSRRGCGQILALPRKREPETDRISSPGHRVIFAGPRLLMLRDLSSGADLSSFLELICWPPNTET